MPQTNYAVRLRSPYETLRQTISDWTGKASKVVVYEHPEQDNVHCHLLLIGVHCTEQTLKDMMRKHGVGLKGAGQLSFKTSFKNPDKVVLPINEETALKYITYMSKGKYEPKFYTGYSAEVLETCKSLWVDHRKKSPDEVLYLSFYAHIREKEKQYNVVINDLKMIKSYALLFAKTQKYNVINLGCRRDASMLWTTYAYESHLIQDVVLPFDV